MTIHLPIPKTRKALKSAKKTTRALPPPDTRRSGKRVSSLPTVFERLASRK